MSEPSVTRNTVLAYLDGLSDDAAAHIYPSDLEKCMTSECVVEVASVRAGNGDESTVPLFSREQVVAALAAAPAQSGVRQFTDDERQFTKKPVTIQAIQWTGRNLREVIAFTDGPPDTRSAHAGMAWDAYVDLVARDGLMIYTLEDGPDRRAKHFADIGDWIIRGVKGEHYPCKDEIFRLTYEPVVARES